MSRNVNRVPKKQWRKWSDGARKVFNDLYGFMMKNASLCRHPKQEPPKPRHWKTIAWNAAWIAADAVDGCVPTKIVNV